MNLRVALGGGLAGTFAGAILHESLKKVTIDAPCMELLDMEALSKVLKGIHLSLPASGELLKWTLAGEIISHTLYYTFAGLGDRKKLWLNGVVLGLAAGTTAVALPKPLGLNGAPVNRKPQTQAMTIALYVVAGLVTSAVCEWLYDKEIS